jgi:hypothetical protein
VQKGNACERRRERKAGDEEDEETEHFFFVYVVAGNRTILRKNSLRIVLLSLQDKHTLLQPHAGMEEGGNQAVAEFGQQPLDFLQPFPQHVVRFPNLLSFFLFFFFFGLLLPFLSKIFGGSSFHAGNSFLSARVCLFFFRSVFKLCDEAS